MTKTLTRSRQELYERLESKIGNTPLHQIKNIPIPNRNRIYAKEELRNPTSSTFDRLYPSLFMVAEESGFIVPGVTPVIEASTGNAGASFAWCAKELGYNAAVITHEDTPQARVQQIQSYGARIVFSPAGQYAAGYVKELEQILARDKIGKGKLGEDPTRMYCLTKIKNSFNAPGFERLVKEVETQLGSIDFFICGVGSGSTVSSLGRIFKRNNQTKVIAIEPNDSAVITSFKQGRIAEIHPLEMLGIGAAGLPPEKLDIDLSLIDDVVLVTNNDWRTGYQLLRDNEKKEVGRSSCAAFKVALDLSKKVSNKNILTLFGDPSWKYTENYPYLK